MSEETTWYSIYQVEDERGGDADFVPHDTKEQAVEEARGYLEFAGGSGGEVFVIPMPTALCNPTGEDDNWSLWDILDKVAPRDYVWLHCGEKPLAMRREAGMPFPTADIVEDLRILADGQDDELGRMLEKAAAEIVRLRAAIK